MKDVLLKFRLPIIIVAVLALFILIAVVTKGCGRGGGISETETEEAEEILSHFTESVYPVTSGEQKDGTLILTLDGSITPDLHWSIENASEEIVSVIDSTEEKDGRMTATIAPLAQGYATVSFLREGRIGKTAYTAAQIDAQLLVTVYEDGSMAVYLSDIYQNNKTAGAADSKTPYLVEGNRILLPGGGDWTVTEAAAGGGEPAGVFSIYSGNTDEDSTRYIGVYEALDHAFYQLAQDRAGTQEAAAEEIEAAAGTESAVEDISLWIPDEELEAIRNARIVLHSESLGVTQVFTFRINENGEPELKVSAESADDLILLDAGDESESATEEAVTEATEDVEP